MDVEIFVIISHAEAIVAESLRSIVSYTTNAVPIRLLETSVNTEANKYLISLTAKNNCQLTECFDPIPYGQLIFNALRTSNANYVAFVASDSIVSRDWLEHVIDQAATAGDEKIIVPVTKQMLYATSPELENLPIGLLALACENDLFEIEKPDINTEFPIYVLQRELLLTLMARKFEVIKDFFGSEHAFWNTVVTEMNLEFSVASRCCVTSISDGSNVFSSGESEGSYVPSLVQNKRQKAVHKVENIFGKTILSRQLVNRSVVYLLSSLDRSGEAQAIIDEVSGLRDCGLNTVIAVPPDVRVDILKYRPNVEAWLIPLENGKGDPLGSHPHIDIVIATDSRSMSFLANIVTFRPKTVPMYYIQNYEPPFHLPGDPKYAQAIRSFSLLSNAIYFAKSSWLSNLVEAAHGIHVEKIAGGVHRKMYSAFDRHARRTPKSLRIATHIDPKTDIGTAVRTFHVLEKIKKQFGKGVQIAMFGATDEELDGMENIPSFEFVNFGKANSQAVAEIFRTADIFLDCSSYQAFGQLGIQAMACGCAAILPMNGGCNEYAENRKNALLVKTHEREEVIRALHWLITTPELRESIAEAGQQKAAEFFLGKAVCARLVLFERALHKKQVESSLHQALETANASWNIT